MEQITLREFVLKNGQARAARALGAKPSSIAKALRTGRAITVTINDDASCSGEETRPFPSKHPMQSDGGYDPKAGLCQALGQANGRRLA